MRDHELALKLAAELERSNVATQPQNAPQPQNVPQPDPHK